MEFLCVCVCVFSERSLTVMLAVLLDTLKHVITIGTFTKLSLYRKLHISKDFIFFRIMVDSQIYVSEIVTIVCFHYCQYCSCL